MQFHPGKCQVITITHNRTIIQHDYILHGHVLEHVKEAKYLSATLTSDLRWNRHIANVSTKANRTLSFLRRNLQINAPVMKTTAYNTLVCPIVEFAPAVWDHYTVGNICKVQYSTVQYSKYHTVPCITVQYSTVQYSMYSTVQYV